MLPPAQIEIDIQKILEQVNKPADILQEYVPDATMSEHEVREKVLAWVKQQCCWRKSFVKKMKIKSITPYPALRYEISSFCEDRKTRLRCVPFKGGLIDGPQNGAPPGPWDIPIESTGFFKTDTLYAEIPHTCEVHPCFRCHARGKVICGKCGGEGCTICLWCMGAGFDYNHRICYGCMGLGIMPCDHCKKTGYVPCPECDGYRTLKTFVELVVRFHSVTDSWVYDRTHLPKENIQEVRGKRIMEQVLPRVNPIQSYKIHELCQASYDLIIKQSRLQHTKRILYQGHHVEQIPVTKILVVHGKKDEEFTILLYGKDRKVFFPDYPQKSCCG